MVLAVAAAGYGGDRRRPVTGMPCAAADAPGGLPPKGRGEKLPPRNGEIPRLNLSRYGGSPWPLIPLTARAPPSLFTAGVVRPGAPKVRP